MSTHHIRLLTLAAVLLAAPAIASPQRPTPAQLKDIDSLYDAVLTCRDYTAEPSLDPRYAEENRAAKKACDFRDDLARKLDKQGFCFLRHYNVGRPSKNRGGCVVLPAH